MRASRWAATPSRRWSWPLPACARRPEPLPRASMARACSCWVGSTTPPWSIIWATGRSTRKRAPSTVIARIVRSGDSPSSCTWPKRANRRRRMCCTAWSAGSVIRTTSCRRSARRRAACPIRWRTCRRAGARSSGRPTTRCARSGACAASSAASAGCWCSSTTGPTGRRPSAVWSSSPKRCVRA